MPKSRDALIDRLTSKPQRPSKDAEEDRRKQEIAARYRDFVDKLNKATETDLQRAELASR